MQVTLASRSEHKLQAAAKQIEAATGVAAQWIAADLSQAAGSLAVVGACSDIDILMTNAGGPPSMPFAQLETSHWQAALEQNFLAAVELIQAVLPGMVSRRFGRIVNITSVSVRSPVTNLELSTAARMALTGFVASVSREVAQHNITINNLLPGTIMTDRLQELGPVAETLIASVPAGRAGTPAEFGAACAFLCSEAAGFIVGQNLSIDGGLVRATI
ncbi:SDR family oxidoreductase [Alcaligenes faecalis]|nr:SDR family oxidoreductase [Alcaligenes faecalis]